MPVRTIKTINLPERERMELGILLPLLGQRDGAGWELTEKPNADAAIVDTEAAGASAALEDARRAATVVLTISASDQGLSELHLARPLRMKALTEVLAAVEKSTADTGSVERAAVAWELKRWPRTEQLRREWRLTRVCGTLARGPQTATAIATRTGIEETEIARLLTLLSEDGCAERTESSVSISESRSNPPPRGLFGRLRARLGRAST